MPLMSHSYFSVPSCSRISYAFSYHGPSSRNGHLVRRRNSRTEISNGGKHSSNGKSGLEGQVSVEEEVGRVADRNQPIAAAPPSPSQFSASVNPAIDKDINKVIQKTAATFAPRASTASKNPAVPGTVLYAVFEFQGYASMLFGGALSFNIVFPSNEPDIWRLMGMWSIWMFTIPSLRARDCSKNEKEALNYLFIIIPLLNIFIPFFLKSFAVVWSADTFVFFVIYAWKLGWLQRE
ncbi:hypothetical protein HPP92_018567 [Vanilla planifolia]|uniref:Protein RESISTANCE TO PHYTOPHTHORA 1, chloroplastic n=1 Tax=Vanilla planifolia TaxID=51239 RepID=A0A835UN07_VANPL|nr:hypothetical protein HPP92_018567 [Vanilla planifolia]